MPYWDYLAAPDQQALFDQAMEQRAGALSLACVPVLDWPASGTLSPTSAAWCTGCGRPNSTSWGSSRRCASTPTGSPESDLPDRYIWTGSL
jgi:hypothetical protein